MFKRRAGLGLFTLSLLLLGLGCISPKSYVDPALPKVEAASINRDDPKIVALEAQFFRQGKRLPKADAQVQNQVRTQLLASGAVKEVLARPDPALPLLHVELNNVGDTGAAVGKGIGTGLTFGLVGSRVTDGYVFTAILKRPGQPDLQKIYNHAIHTTIGNKKGPEGLEPMTTQLAFEKVVEGLVLNMVKDFQAEGAL
jgi:hypothetical protein